MRQGLALGRVQNIGQGSRNAFMARHRGRFCRHGLAEPAKQENAGLGSERKIRRMKSRCLRRLNIEQQEFPLPGADDLAVVLHFLKFHVLIGGDEFLAQHLLQRLGVVQLVERLVEIDRQSMGIAIGRTGHRLRWLDALDHAQIAAGERCRKSQIRIGIGARHPVLHPQIGRT